MRIGGLQKFSLIDYPGKLSCVIFTQGCNFRCPYCHNRELVLPEAFRDPIPEDDVFVFLKKCRPYLDGVVVTGGEPTEHEDLPVFLGKIRDLGYLIKVDTNGSRPHVIRDLTGRSLVDFWAMDIKTSPEKYSRAVGVRFPFSRIHESIDIIRTSGIEHEFRTTVVRPVCGYEDVCRIASIVSSDRHYRLQAFRPSPKMINLNFRKNGQPSSEEISAWNLNADVTSAV